MKLTVVVCDVLDGYFKVRVHLNNVHNVHAPEQVKSTLATTDRNELKRPGV